MNWTLFKPKTKTNKKLIENFLRTGKSTHSASASSVGHILKYCEDNNIPYRLTAIPKFRYQVEKLNEDELNANNIKELNTELSTIEE